VLIGCLPSSPLNLAAPAAPAPHEIRFIESSSYRMHQHADLLPPVTPLSPQPGAMPKRRGRPPKAATNTMVPS